MKLLNDQLQLAYCTNIHPAESWAETFAALKEHTLSVRDTLRANGDLAPTAPYAIGLRLSALAAAELEPNLPEFQDWLRAENCYVFTINGFPYGAFHGTRVKEKVYKPDWTTDSRLDYTRTMARIISALNPAQSNLSISTLPGSFKAFHAYEPALFYQLIEIADYLEELSVSADQHIHLGLEPEPLGHFENLSETIAFFQRLWDYAPAEKVPLLQRRIGVNYDTCHFALEYEDCHSALDALIDAGIFISKVHLSNALTFDPQDSRALVYLRDFDEPTYLHQVLCRHPDGTIVRFTDIPEFFAHLEQAETNPYVEARCHFHIPLYTQASGVFGSTIEHAQEALTYLQKVPDYCSHLEIETYTWGVLPTDLQRPLATMISQEYAWALTHVGPAT